uniref:Uncharacterized protein n=1 Tax=Romanomermis culicivorax TaxID=13658 RepID=A0A915HPH8_ROMCU
MNDKNTHPCSNRTCSSMILSVTVRSTTASETPPPHSALESVINTKKLIERFKLSKTILNYCIRSDQQRHRRGVRKSKQLKWQPLQNWSRLFLINIITKHQVRI